MKILKIFGLVVGIHLFALTLIFTNPGCSSSTKPAPLPSETFVRSEPVPRITVPDGSNTVSLPSVYGPPPDFNPEAPATAAPTGVRFTPTRPDTPVASALVAEPVVEVTPITTHTVVAGDSLWMLSKRYGVSTTEIAAANDIRTSDVIPVGRKLIIPAASPRAAVAPVSATPTEPVASKSRPAATAATPRPSATGVKHTVKLGDTLSTIARQYGVRQGDIAVANNISDPGRIRAGTELTIPGWKKPETPAQPAESTPPPAKAAPAPKQDDPRLIFSVDPDEQDDSQPAPGASEVPVIRVDDNPVSPAPRNP